ncbi:hypothetical protein B0F90DRAFT_1715146 [Multifurca ochricompacta]|uniref:C2 domain-containing protein n=1 Tax=Multifurca ochricompacta TaxID=376703 RepID=A0AAD4M6Z7_9AGAM|nr:hypothetical protein B0F90DRAFT_1715146 [Multifurca ochricompacta]
MTTTVHNIGTLIVVILKARNLPNKRQFGKQDPYCAVVLNGETRKTKVIKRGGQHPEWDEEIRFTIYEDSNALRASSDGTPPPLPPKAGRGPKKIQGGEKMALACFAADKEPDLIGETIVDLTEVLTRGETDEWFTLFNKDKYSGEVYLELTFWSNEPRPEKKATPRLAKVNKQYGGPGVFVPSEESHGNLQQGSSSFHDSGRRDSLPSSPLPSNSSMRLDLYKPDYEQTVRGRAQNGASMERLVNDMGELIVSDARRRDTFPPVQSGFSTRSVSTSGYSVSSSPSQLFPVSDGPIIDAATPGYVHRAVTPVGQRPHRYSLSSSQSHEIAQYQPAYEPNPPSSRSSYHQPSRHGPRYSMPVTSSGFILVSSTFESASHSTRPLASYGSEPSGLAPTTANLTSPGYSPSPSHTPVPVPTRVTPGPSVSPVPMISTTSTPASSFLSASLSQQTQPLYVPQSGYNHPISAPPTSRLPVLPLPTFPNPPQSASSLVPQSLTQPVSGQPHEYMSPSVLVPHVSPSHVASNHVLGSRPLPPQPQQVNQRVLAPAPLPPNQAYSLSPTGALPLPYGQNHVPSLNTDIGLPPVQQNVLPNPLPVPPGPPGPLGPGSHTPPNSKSYIVPTGPSFHYVPSPSPQPSPSRQSPNPRVSDGMAQPISSLPPSPVPPQPGHPRSVSGRPSLPFPPPPLSSMMTSYQQQPFPQLPIPPALVLNSQSQQQHLAASTSSVIQGGQSFYPGPPPRPPVQIANPLQPKSHHQAGP